MEEQSPKLMNVSLNATTPNKSQSELSNICIYLMILAFLVFHSNEHISHCVFVTSCLTLYDLKAAENMKSSVY